MYLWLIELYSEVMKLSKLLNADFWDKIRVLQAGKLEGSEDW